MNLFICNKYSKIYFKSVIFLCILILTAKVSTASEYKDNINEYKAPSGGWKLLVKEDKIHTSRGTTYVLTAVSPKGEQIHIDDNVRNAEVKWLNGETIEIIDHCGLDCKYVYFYDTHKGLSRIFSDAIAYSIADNLIAYPSYNEKKKRIEIIVSEIYTKKEEPVAVIYRKWSDNWFDWVVMFLTEQAVNKGILKGRDKIYLEYVKKGSEKIKKEDIFLKKRLLSFYVMTAHYQQRKTEKFNIAQ